MSNRTLSRPGTAGLSFRGPFKDLFSPWTDWFKEPAWERSLTMPAVNISEDEHSYSLSVAAPGLKKDDFNIEVDKNVLTISSEKEESTEDKGKDYRRCEYNYSSFSRSFTLPEEVKQDAIDATYNNGELVITLPKQQSEKKVTTKVIVK